MIIVMTTVADAADGRALAEKIVETNLAGCVQILPQMTSVYIWEGKVHTDDEHLLLIKTTENKWERLREFISQNHSYSVPEIAAIRAAHVSDDYSKWLGTVLADRS